MNLCVLQAGGLLNCLDVRYTLQENNFSGVKRIMYIVGRKGSNTSLNKAAVSVLMLRVSYVDCMSQQLRLHHLALRGTHIQETGWEQKQH